MSCTSLTDSAVGGLEFSEVVEKGLVRKEYIVGEN